MNFTSTKLLLLAYALCAFIQGKSQDLSNGLIVHLPMNGDLLNVAQNTLHGNAMGSIMGSDREGNTKACQEFNGLSQFAIIHDLGALGALQDMSISLWINAYELPSRTDNLPPAIVFGKWTEDPDKRSYGLSLHEDGQLSFRYRQQAFPIWNSLGFSQLLSTQKIETNKWYHIAIVRAGKELFFYLDNSLEGKTDIAHTKFNPSQKEFTLGAAVGANFRGFKGAVDELRIYDRPLTTTEIQTIFQGVTSINESQSKNEMVQFFPNPSNGLVSMRTSHSEPLEIKILDQFGKEVWATQNAQSFEKFDLSHLPAELYWVQIYSQQELLYSSRLLIVH